ncbi:uncharacterized protein LOC104898940 isoform X2 [Beta vulgaris subsp. vulgaris]|uniref:uncharacterized protein LOC104898940 isoform X2 n=1 Tax=Beta vulgaris subsp. vulgaris TaxID=3555 RepID=UPI002546AED7|nr:uncharacterized protein LOC104898940 isoform X2 [Beta vulgaris subsp. vulgaris]
MNIKVFFNFTINGFRIFLASNPLLLLLLENTKKSMEFKGRISEGNIIKRIFASNNFASCVAVRLILMNQFVSEYEHEVLQSGGRYNTLLACGVYVRKMNAYFLITGRYTRLFINPDNVDASTLLDW